MNERTRGLYGIVTVPALYAAIQRIVGGEKARRAARDRLFPDLVGKSVLEIGCGPGTWAAHLTDAKSYCGIDWNEKHIAASRARFAEDARFSFVCGDLGDPGLLLDDQEFDLILAIGILHHLDDTTARSVLRRCTELLSPAGCFLAVEPVYHDGQHFFARWLKDRDSGQHIRDEAGYRALFEGIMPGVRSEVVTDMMRVPYSHCILRGAAQ